MVVLKPSQVVRAKDTESLLRWFWSVSRGLDIITGILARAQVVMGRGRRNRLMVANANAIETWCGPIFVHMRKCIVYALRNVETCLRFVGRKHGRYTCGREIAQLSPR